MSDDKQKLREIRAAARKLLYEISGVPMRAVDCDQDAVDEAFARLAKLSGYRG